MIKAIPMEDWLRGCIYHDGRHGYVTLPIDKVHQIANYIQMTRRSGMDGLIDLEVVEADHKTENCSEKPNNCEAQTIRCPKCGRTDYIRNMEKDMGIKGSLYKYKCINCNTYIKDEPTISKMGQVDKDINVRSKTEPQTDCAWK